MKKVVFLTMCLLIAYSNCFAATSESNLDLSDGYVFLQKTYLFPISYEFEDKYNFYINGDSDVKSISTSWTIPSSIDDYALSITDFSLSLFDESATSLFSYTSSQISDNIIEYSDELASGNYYFLVSGTTSGLNGGAYSLEVNAVPVPAAALLLGSGLLGIVGFRRRQNV